MTEGQFPSGPGRSQPSTPDIGPATGDGSQVRELLTFVATDLAESSRVLSELGEERVETSLAAYLTIVRTSVAAARGRELARDGDRLLIAFDSPSEAVRCATAIQRAVERHDRRGLGRLDVRIGVHIGEAIESSVVSDGGDYQARPAIQVSQLCGAASGGQIIVSGVVVALSHLDAAVSFERTGLLDVDGAAEPMPMYEAAVRRSLGERPPLPAALTGRPADRCSFIGRLDERERLWEVWTAAAGGERRLVLVSGEPGIGKSRLAAEFATEAHADGAVVLSGRSFEESIVPYQPFVEALRQYIGDCDPAGLEAQLGGDAAPLVALVPELADRLPARVTEDLQEGERYRLFDAVAAMLATISIGSPLLLVLDDLQWADPATLLLMKHIVLDPRPASMLILGLYRDTEVAVSHPLRQLQADVGRDYSIDRIRLGGLGEQDVASMLDEMIGWSPPETVVRGLCTDTEGNPFFLEEVITHLDETGIAADRERMVRGSLVSGELGVPVRIRDFVARRMQRLSREALEVLGVASFIGTEFTLDILAAVLAIEPDELVDRLEEAIEAHLVIEVPGQAGHYAFSHALFQGALHEEHGRNRRASLHARVAQAIEASQPDDASSLSELARHYSLSAGRYAQKVVHYGSAAGDRALAGLAYEDAIEEYTRALDALASVAAADDQTQADLLVRLGDAHTRVGGAAAAKRSFLAAAAHCVGEGPSSTLARAALGYGGTAKLGGIFDPFQAVDRTLVGLLERAIEACPCGEEVTRVRLLGRLAQALYWSDEHERMLSLSQEALDTARRIGDRTAIAHALHSRHVALWGPDHTAELRATAEEMLALGESLGDPDIELRAYTWLISDALETDAPEVVSEYVEGYVRIAEELHRPYLLGYAESIQAARAHLEGRFDDMDRAMEAQLARSVGAYSRRGQEAHRWQAGLLRLDLGRVDDTVIDILAERAARFPGWTFKAMLALAYATVDRPDDARAELAGLAPGELASLKKDFMWAATLVMLTRVVARLEAVDYARPLYELLAPYAHRSLVWGSGFMILGPTNRYLGMLATLLGENDLALTHLEGALRQCQELGSPPLVARTQLELARAHLARDAEGDDVCALALLAEAEAGAIRLGLPELAREAGDLARTSAPLEHGTGAGSSGRGAWQAGEGGG